VTFVIIIGLQASTLVGSYIPIQEESLLSSDSFISITIVFFPKFKKVLWIWVTEILLLMLETTFIVTLFIDDYDGRPSSFNAFIKCLIFLFIMSLLYHLYKILYFKQSRYIQWAHWDSNVLYFRKSILVWYSQWAHWDPDDDGCCDLQCGLGGGRAWSGLGATFRQHTPWKHVHVGHFDM